MVVVVRSAATAAAESRGEGRGGAECGRTERDYNARHPPRPGPAPPVAQAQRDGRSLPRPARLSRERHIFLERAGLVNRASGGGRPSGKVRRGAGGRGGLPWLLRRRVRGWRRGSLSLPGRGRGGGGGGGGEPGKGRLPPPESPAPPSLGRGPGEGPPLGEGPGRKTRPGAPGGGSRAKLAPPKQGPPRGPPARRTQPSRGGGRGSRGGRLRHSGGRNGQSPPRAPSPPNRFFWLRRRR